MENPINNNSQNKSLKSNIIIALLIGALAVVFVNILGTEAYTLGIDGWTNQAIKGVLLSGIVVAGIWLLRKRNGFAPRDIGHETRPKAAKKFLLGMALILVPLTITITVAFITGWGGLKINSSGPVLSAMLFAFVLTFLTDALPEELLFRGYIYTNLNTRFTKVKSSLITIVLFALIPVVSMLIQKQLLGYEVLIGGANTITPSYIITLIFFGAFVLYLRILTRSLWTGVGFHLVFVFMNQLMGPSEGNLLQFTSVEGEQPLQLTLMGLILAIFIALLIYPRLTKQPIGWGEKLIQSV
ncbi:MAG: CPBP family intramembrane metalloprotease [Roseivirga sp.]|nr:CPBP family intramembrane metalloprotease [Roseivirga sp.]